MNFKKLLLLTGGLTLTVAASQHVAALPSGGFLFGEVAKTKQPAAKKACKKGAPSECSSGQKNPFPQGGFFSIGDNKLSQPAVKTTPTKIPESAKQKKHTSGKIGNKSNAEQITSRITELQGTMQNVADEIRALEISKKTLGNDVTPITNKELSSWGSKHFYIGLGASYAWIGVKDKISADKRTIKWNEQKVDYYAMVSSILYTVKTDGQGNIEYGDDGLPKYEKQKEPMDDDIVKSFYEEVTEDDETYMKLKDGITDAEKNQLKARLKVLVDEFLEKLNILETDSKGDNTIRYTQIEIGDNNYSGIDTEGNGSKKHEFYFGDSEEGTSDNNELKFADGLTQLENLNWHNLIFTNYDSILTGHHVTLLQAMGEYAEQTFEGQQTMTAANIPGVYTTMTSARCSDEVHDGTKNDKYEKTAEMEAIDN
ncbi:MAG: hypothetical protein LBP31_01440, partial [Holosporales bacterium]|nr:hypothetical protein [Holosporales bacterium]